MNSPNQNLFEKYVNWDNLRLIFPLIFVGIMTSYLYGYFFPPEPLHLDRNPEVPEVKGVSDVPEDDESKINSEFETLCTFLVDRALSENRTPPESLPGALDLIKRSWKGPGKFQQVFRLICQVKDPWNQPFVYRVDHKEKAIFLKSYGPNGIDDQTSDDDIDDIHVTRNYHLRDSK